MNFILENKRFAEIMDEESGSFFLTDFLVEAFEKTGMAGHEDRPSP